MDMQKIVIMSLVSSLIIFTTTAFSLETHQSQNKRILLASNGKFIPSPEEDALITKNIKKHISNSQTLSRFHIGVLTHKGIVTLKGNVNSNSQAAALIQLASSIVGVRDVRSQITVQGSNQVLRDTIITAKVKGLFVREGIFGPKRPLVLTSVETRNGVVYLTGTINDKRKIDRAIHLVRGVSGVKSVEYKYTKFTPH